jgi:hypothetical protein
MVMMSGMAVRREARPKRSSKPPKHSVQEAMTAFSIGIGMPSSWKKPAVAGRSMSLPLPAVKNCQPQ